MIDEKELIKTIENLALRIRHLETLTKGEQTAPIILLEDGSILLLEDYGELYIE